MKKTTGLQGLEAEDLTRRGVGEFIHSLISSFCAPSDSTLSSTPLTPSTPRTPKDVKFCETHIPSIIIIPSSAKAGPKSYQYNANKIIIGTICIAKSSSNHLIFGLSAITAAILPTIE